MTIVFKDEQKTLDVQKVEYCYKNKGFENGSVKLTAAYATNTDNLVEAAQEVKSLLESEEFSKQMKFTCKAEIFSIEVTERKSGAKPFFEVSAELTFVR